MGYLTYFITLLIGLGFSQPACALLDFTSPEQDKSIEFLAYIFGQMGPFFHDADPSLMGLLFRLFNIAVLSLGSIVVSYTIILSTLNTAQEGEIMGRKWSSLWIPLRCGVGMSCLLPSISGYSLIQILIMKFILLGIGAANQIWHVAFETILIENQKSEKIVDDIALKKTAQGLLEGLVCAQAFNNDPVCKTAIQNEVVVAYQDNNHLYIGVPHHPHYHSLCGTFTPATPPASLDPQAWYNVNLTAMQAALSDLQPLATMLYAYDDPTYWESHEAIKAATHTLRSVFLHTEIPALSDETKQKEEEKQKEALQWGWIMSGQYYFALTNQNDKKIHYTSPHYDIHPPTTIGNQAIVQWSTYKTRVMNYLTSCGLHNITQGVDNNASSSMFSSLFNTFSSYAENAFQELFNMAHLIHSPTDLTESMEDPLASLRSWGRLIIKTTENILFGVIVIAIGLMTANCTGLFATFFSSGCSAVGGILSLLIPIFTLCLLLLWGAGITLAMYIPLIPYLVFTFTILGWFILVIEAMVAAPVVALGLVSPATELLGKASASVTIVAGVFLRPSLMVIGFILSIKLVQASIKMINLGFREVVELSVGNIGVFGYIILIGMYTALVTAIIHECFSLIHILPDKIIRWIGHAAEQSPHVMKSVQQVREATDKGQQQASDLFKGASSKIFSKVEEEISRCQRLSTIQLGGADGQNN